jgi:hypothetical protein
VVVRRLRGGPHEDLSSEEPLAALDRCYVTLVAELAAHEPARQVGPDPAETVGFWMRRMAYETLIHRIDVEGALREPCAPVPSDVAIDAISEMLDGFLVHETHTFTAEYAAHLTDWSDRCLLLSTPGGAWRVTIHPDGADVSPAAASSRADALVHADPLPLLLWLYGRPSAVRITGDATLVDQVKRVLGAATGAG